MTPAEVDAYQARVRELAAQRHQAGTADRIFDEIAAHYHGRMQTAGVWVPWGDYIIEAVDDPWSAGSTKRCATGWTVRCGNRIVAKGVDESPYWAWRSGCRAIADDLELEAAS